jgi:hypothetical protein
VVAEVRLDPRGGGRVVDAVLPTAAATAANVATTPTVVAIATITSVHDGDSGTGISITAEA